MKPAIQNLVRRADLLAFLLLGILGVLALNYSMALQPVGNSDTALYFNLARNIADGNGLVTNYPSGRLAFVGLHPPFYSILLSLLIRLQIPLIEGVKVANILFYAAILVGSGLWIRRLTKSWFCGFLVSAALLVNPGLFITFNRAMSEPLYLLLALASLFMLVEGLSNPLRRYTWLLFSAILAGLAAFTRFAGLSSILLGCLALLLFLTNRPKKRWLLAFLYGAIGSLPLLYWFIVKWALFAADTVRGVIFPHNFLLRCAWLFFGVLDSVINWIPDAMRIANIPLRRYGLLILGIVILGVLIWRKYRSYRALLRERDPRILVGLVSFLLLVCYLFVFFLSYVFSSVPPDINERTLILLLPCLLIALASFLRASLDSGHNRKWDVLVWGVALACLAALIPTNAVKTVSLARELHQTEDGYLQAKYVDSELLDAIAGLPEQRLLISNQAALILLHTGRYPYELSEFACDKLTARGNVPFGAGDTEDDQYYREGKLLALFSEDLDWAFARCFLPEEWAARRDAFLSASVPLVTTSDGVLYQYSPNASTR